jgi:REP element-mobilizing transposase RayT
MMQQDGYKIRDQYGVYFITFATVQWVDVFSRYCYVQTILDSLQYCIKEKGLHVHAWYIMSNHIHLIISSPKGHLSDILRDFKKFTAATIIKQTAHHAEESRKH